MTNRLYAVLAFVGLLGAPIGLAVALACGPTLGGVLGLVGLLVSLFCLYVGVSER